jgi:hypothetical protein
VRNQSGMPTVGVVAGLRLVVNKTTLVRLKKIGCAVNERKAAAGWFDLPESAAYHRKTPGVY